MRIADHRLCVVVTEDVKIAKKAREKREEEERWDKRHVACRASHIACRLHPNILIAMYKYMCTCV